MMECKHGYSKQFFMQMMESVWADMSDEAFIGFEFTVGKQIVKKMRVRKYSKEQSIDYEPTCNRKR